MLPLRNETTKGFPAATLLFVAGCVTIFFTQREDTYVNALVPLDFFHALFHPQSETSLAAVKTIFTSFFLHSDLFHLLSNMWFLWIFGSAVESRTGFFKFSFIYCICGLFSMGLQAAVSPFSTIPIVGASGAIAGLMGMHLIYYPFGRILVFLPPIFLFRLPAFAFLLPWAWIQYRNLDLSTAQNPGVAWWAHAGGFVAGVILALRSPQKKQTSPKSMEQQEGLKRRAR